MREDLLPGDLLMYRPGKSWLGKALSWGEWTNTPREGLEYCHVGIVLAPAGDQGFEMNPPSSHYTVLSKEGWDCIDVFRPTVPIIPAVLADWAHRNQGASYPYFKIGQFLGAGLLARLGLTRASRWMGGLGETGDHHSMVCSATVCQMLNEASKWKMEWPKDADDMRPADIPLGKVVRV